MYQLDSSYSQSASDITQLNQFILSSWLFGPASDAQETQLDLYQEGELNRVDHYENTQLRARLHQPLALLHRHSPYWEVLPLSLTSYLLDSKSSLLRFEYWNLQASSMRPSRCVLSRTWSINGQPIIWSFQFNSLQNRTSHWRWWSRTKYRKPRSEYIFLLYILERQNMSWSIFTADPYLKL